MTQNQIQRIKRIGRSMSRTCLGAAAALAVAGLLAGCCPTWMDAALEAACVDSGGTVVTVDCNCPGVCSFFNNCAVGACTCSPELPSHEVTACDCGAGRCFDGTECVVQDPAVLEAACVDSGGTVVTQACNCEGTPDFYDNCAVGACSCPPGSPEHDVTTCNCGEGRCFDGTECVTLEFATLEDACVDSGGTVATQPCNCEGVSDFYDNCAEGACTCSPEFPSYDVTVCDCGEGLCFDGTECVTWEYAMGEDACLASGGTVT
ncbi:MAG: hypothetical protein JSU68_14740, partial [Phycisphaerales bacterium]